MMHESKGLRFGKATSIHLFHSIVRYLKCYLQGTHTYKTDAMHMLLDHTFRGHVGGGKWPGDDTKTMPCTFDTIISLY